MAPRLPHVRGRPRAKKGKPSSTSTSSSKQNIQKYILGIIIGIVLILSGLNISVSLGNHNNNNNNHDRNNDIGLVDDTVLPKTKMTAATTAMSKNTIINADSSVMETSSVPADAAAPAKAPSFTNNTTSTISSTSSTSVRQEQPRYLPPSKLKPPSTTKQLFVTLDGKEFTHYFMHIPKSGASYCFKALMKMVLDGPEMAKLPPNQKFRPCNMGTRPLKVFADEYPTKARGRKCTMWHSEDVYQYDIVAQHMYTIIRHPRDIILSMYYHCTESVHHKNQAHFMPKGGLDEWLNAFVDILESKNNDTTDPKRTKLKLAEQKRREFQCYNPIEFQSTFTKFYKHPNGTMLANIQEAKEDLKNRFDIIGDTAQMAKSACAIHIKYTGWVPPECNCTGITTNTTTPSTSTTTKRKQDKVPVYNVSEDSHGVQHHAATTVTTLHQEEQIRKLAGLDFVLYDVSKKVFAEQLRDIEQEYNVVLCNEFRQ